MYCVHARKRALGAPRTHFRACTISWAPDPLTQSILWGPTFCICPGPPQSSQRPCFRTLISVFWFYTSAFSTALRTLGNGKCWSCMCVHYNHVILFGKIILHHLVQDSPTQYLSNPFQSAIDYFNYIRICHMYQWWLAA